MPRFYGRVYLGSLSEFTLRFLEGARHLNKNHNENPDDGKVLLFIQCLRPVTKRIKQRVSQADIAGLEFLQIFVHYTFELLLVLEILIGRELEVNTCFFVTNDVAMLVHLEC